YYDFLELPDGKFGIALGDISGKGIGAALMMANLQASLRGQAPILRNMPELLKREGETGTVHANTWRNES
ncbi:MAG: SpoIIE family protein phosphatase, partial [Bryobacteraceae bacterium]